MLVSLSGGGGGWYITDFGLVWSNSYYLSRYLFTSEVIRVKCTCRRKHSITMCFIIAMHTCLFVVKCGLSVTVTL